MRQRWTLFVVPLLCGLLGDLCWILLPFGPRGDRAVGPLILYSIVGTAIVWELFQAQQPRRRGLVELRSIRRERRERPAFLVPFFPHVTMAIAFLGLLLVGVTLDLLISSVVHPIRFREEATIQNALSLCDVLHEHT